MDKSYFNCIQVGFGFNLFFAFVFPAFVLINIVIALIFVIIGKYEALRKLLKGWGIFLGIIFLLAAVIYAIHFFTDKKDVNKNDIYGNYIIDKSKYPGKGANWQYDHFRFEITKKDSFLFYITNKKKIVKTYRGTIQYVNRGRIVLNVPLPRSGAIEDTPTLYRNTFSFYYVFHSKYYNNVFFKKGNWE